MLNEIESIITPDGAEIIFGDPNVRVITKIGGRGAPPVEHLTVRGYQQQSETVLGFMVQPRVISMTLSWNSVNRAQYWAARRALSDSLRVNRGGPVTLKHARADGTIRCIQALADSSPVFENDLVEWDTWEETLSFICYDPIFYNPIPVTKTYVAAASGYLRFPITFPMRFGDSLTLGHDTLDYDGTWATWPRITVHGPYTSFELLNQTTGKKIRLGAPILAGEQRIIDLTPGAATIKDAVGTNRFYELVLPDSDLLGTNIRPVGEDLGDDNPYGGVEGGHNTLVLTAPGFQVGETSVSYSFYERFYSVD